MQKALAKGTRRIDLKILDDNDDDIDVVDADFVDVPDETLPAVIQPVSVTPGRARRATDAYAPVTGDRRPIIAIG
jgi:hypothetical protein